MRLSMFRASEESQFTTVRSIRDRFPIAAGEHPKSGSLLDSVKVIRTGQDSSLYVLTGS